MRAHGIDLASVAVRRSDLDWEATASRNPGLPELSWPVMIDLAGLVRGLADLLRPQLGNADSLNEWISIARTGDLPHLQAFPRGLDLDRTAVTNRHIGPPQQRNRRREHQDQKDQVPVWVVMAKRYLIHASREGAERRRGRRPASLPVGRRIS